MIYKIISIFFILVFLAVSAAAFSFWLEIQKFEPDVYYYVPAERSFIYSPEEIAEFGFEEYIKERITVEKARLIERKKNFIYLDLKKMELTLYKEGEKLEKFFILGKGKQGTWWETAPGVYFVGDKVANHFSSFYRVWMPYGVQFYGNFFIHGWPYYSGGKPLPPGPSGGCARLSTPDAAVVFAFAERGMPVLVFEEKTASPLPALLALDRIKIPEINAPASIVADLDSGEILLSREIKSDIFAGPAIFGMMALTASEVVNLEKRTIARDWMFAEAKEEKIIIPGRNYKAYELLSPLLSRSSKQAALVLSRFYTPEFFVAAMNVKAKAIGMNNTVFEDVTGSSKENTTTLYDTARMMRYIKEYRGFIFEISREIKFSGENETETILTVLKMKKSDNFYRNIFIGIADSENAREELENILFWLGDNFGLN